MKCSIVSDPGDEVESIEELNLFGVSLTDE